MANNFKCDVQVHSGVRPPLRMLDSSHMCVLEWTPCILQMGKHLTPLRKQKEKSTEQAPLLRFSTEVESKMEKQIDQKI